LRHAIPKPIFLALPPIAILLAGCPTPSSWTTPRTLPEGESTHTIGLEWFTFKGAREDLNGDGDTRDAFESGTYTLPFVFPAYVFRTGLADIMDLGVKASLAGDAVVDFKLQAVRSEFFDLAFDPSLQIGFVSYAALPVLFGINAGEFFQVTLSPRLTYGYAVDDDTTDPIDGVFYGGSVGLRIAPTDRLAILPEINILERFDTEGAIITAGLGISFGRGQPDYRSEEDVAAQAPPPGPPIVQ